MVRIGKAAVVLGVALLALVSTAVADHAAAGTLKSVGADGTTFVVTDEQGKDWTYRMVDQAAIICPEAKEAKLSDLKAGSRVSVLSEKKGDQYMATAVLHHEGAYKNAGLGHGTVKSANNAQIVITDPKGKDWTYVLSENTRTRLNNRDAKITAFKAGDMVTFAYSKQGDAYVLHNICNTPRS